MSGTVLSNQDTAVNKTNKLMALSCCFKRDDKQVNKSRSSFQILKSTVKKIVNLIQESNRDRLL